MGPAASPSLTLYRRPVPLLVHSMDEDQTTIDEIVSEQVVLRYPEPLKMPVGEIYAALERVGQTFAPSAETLMKLRPWTLAQTTFYPALWRPSAAWRSFSSRGGSGGAGSLRCSTIASSTSSCSGRRVRQ